MKSEFELIDLIRRSCRSAPPHLIGSIGDDCAVFDPSFARRWTITSDVMVEDVDFRTSWASPWLLGRKAVRVNLSDLAAMGARPYACLLDLCLPVDLEEGYVRAVIEGFVAEAEERGLPLIGGDISRSEKLTIAVTALGFVRKGEPLARSAGRPGDLLMLMGQVGFSRAGLEILESGGAPNVTRARTAQDLIEACGTGSKGRFLMAHLLPEIPLEAAVWLQESGFANAMIDVSDGLASDTLRILQESGLSGELDLARLAPLPDLKKEIGLDFSVSGGEDFALVFSASPGQKQRMQTARASFPPGWEFPIEIGRTWEGPPRLFLIDSGNRSLYQRGGFDHFR